jgi:hypothetical protein
MNERMEMNLRMDETETEICKEEEDDFAEYWTLQFLGSHAISDSVKFWW